MRVEQIIRMPERKENPTEPILDIQVREAASGINVLQNYGQEIPGAH